MLKRTYGEAIDEALRFLPFTDRGTLEYLWKQYKHWSLTDWLQQQHEVVPEQEWIWFQQAQEKLRQHYPVQYILGFESFYGYDFQVTEDTLIPRPETELLVERILQRYDEQTSLKVLDLGTGTGAIAITLKKERPQWQIVATDISSDALSVAKKNAAQLDAEVRFCCGDLFAPLMGESFDLIVSNPPYIAEEERDVMDESVKQFEPSQALFAKHHGLFIYERLAQESPHHLNKKGSLYLEIGYRQGRAVRQLMMDAFPQGEVEVLKDYSDHDRMVIVQSR